MLFARHYQLISNVQPAVKNRFSVPLKPMRLVSVLNPNEFLVDGLMIHQDTVQIEDFGHDWDWHAGVLSYNARFGDQPQVLALVYAEDEVARPLMRYCPNTGQAVAQMPDADRKELARQLLLTGGHPFEVARILDANKATGRDPELAALIQKLRASHVNADEIYEALRPAAL